MPNGCAAAHRKRPAAGLVALLGAAHGRRRCRYRHCRANDPDGAPTGMRNADGCDRDRDRLDAPDVRNRSAPACAGTRNRPVSAHSSAMNLAWDHHPALLRARASPTYAGPNHASPARAALLMYVYATLLHAVRQRSCPRWALPCHGCPRKPADAHQLLRRHSSIGAQPVPRPSTRRI